MMKNDGAWIQSFLTSIFTGKMLNAALHNTLSAGEQDQ